MASIYLKEFGFTFFLRIQSKWAREGKDCVLSDFFKEQRLNQDQIDELLQNFDVSTRETQRDISEIISPKILISAFEEYRQTPEFAEYNEIRFEHLINELSALIDKGALDLIEESEDTPHLVA